MTSPLDFAIHNLSHHGEALSSQKKVANVLGNLFSPSSSIHSAVQGFGPNSSTTQNRQAVNKNDIMKRLEDFTNTNIEDLRATN
jgi:hypothetical protein